MCEREARFCNLWPVMAIYFLAMCNDSEISNIPNLTVKCFTYTINSAGAAIPIE